jgi:hypothetical protein
MANIKISELNALTPPAAADELPVVDVSASSTKKTTVGEVVGIINGDVEVATDGTATISELPVSKLQDGDARQLLQTDAAGTGVEWTSNIDVPGTLDVTGATTLDSTLGVNGQSTLSSAAVSDLTSGRVVLAGASGELEDNAALAFNGTQLDVDGDVVITGDLTVEGASTILETETVKVEDKNIELGVVASPTDTTADGGGITLKGATDKTLNWVNATDAWTSSEPLDLPAGADTAPALFFNGDTNTGLYSPGADQVAISTNGTGRLFVDAGGRVGIGTSAQQYTVHAEAANARIVALSTSTTSYSNVESRTSGGSSVGLLMRGATATGTTFGQSNANGAQLYSVSADYFAVGTFQSNPLIFGTNNSERLRITSDGKVGLGTSSPSYTLDVTGTGRFTSSTSVWGGTIGQPQTIIGPGTVAAFAAGVGTSSLSLNPTGGNVGIGISVPQAQLQVLNAIKISNSDQSQGSLILGDGSSTAFNVGIARWNGGTNAAGAGGIGYFAQGSGNVGGHFFYTGDAAAGSQTERMRISATGAVGIGTTSPGGLLDVTEDSNTGGASDNANVYIESVNRNANLYLTGNASNTATLYFGDQANALAGRIVYQNSNDSLYFGTNNSAQHVTIDSSGRLLVGTSSSPSASQGANSNLVVQGYVGQPTSGGIISLQRGQASASIASDQLIGRINFNGSDGYPFADITARTDAVAGVGDYPGALVFSTTAAGASSPTERMRITNAGATLIGTSTSNNNARLGVAGSTHIGAGANTVSLANGATGTVITPARGYSYINVSHSNTASDGLLLLVFANTTALTIVNTVHSNAGTRYSVSASGRDLQVTNALGSTASFYASCVTLAWGDNG